jgi:kinesin family protein C2/C3
MIRKSFLETFNITTDNISIDENGKNKSFEFDYIFNQKSHQHEVYEEVSLLVESMMQGNNICVIAYGQTCTGKTYTIQGPNKSHPGIAIRAAKDLFEMIGDQLETKSSNCSKLSLSIIEIYNENIYNLLSDGQPLLNIYENSSNNLVIPDLNPIRINNFNEASKLFTLASKLRHTNQTSYNDRSSRSHCIYSFHLKIVNPDDSKIIRSKFHIIDLAGSERLSKSNSILDDFTKKEAICINLSLHALANVLNALAVKQIHVPYRDSKLTHFLKESLNENYNIILLLHISPNIRDIAETISTLEFGTRIVKICKHKTGKERPLMITNNINK